MVEILRAGALLLTILMTIAFFAGCESSKPQANENSIIKEPDKGHEIHGEVGAAYGRSG